LHQAAQQLFDFRHLHQRSPNKFSVPCPVLRRRPRRRPDLGRVGGCPTFFRAATPCPRSSRGWHGTCTSITGLEH
jgi:hypothetical protein